MLPHLGFRHCLHFISQRIAPTCWFMYFAPTLHIYIVSISTSRICRMMGRLRFYLRVVTSQLSSNRRPCGRRMWKIPSTDICNSNAAKVLVVICIRIDINGPGIRGLQLQTFVDLTRLNCSCIWHSLTPLPKLKCLDGDGLVLGSGTSYSIMLIAFARLIAGNSGLLSISMRRCPRLCHNLSICSGCLCKRDKWGEPGKTSLSHVKHT